jgi:hypothetical protein
MSRKSKVLRIARVLEIFPPKDGKIKVYFEILEMEGSPPENNEIMAMQLFFREFPYKKGNIIEFRMKEINYA